MKNWDQLLFVKSHPIYIEFQRALCNRILFCQRWKRIFFLHFFLVQRFKYITLSYAERDRVPRKVLTP